MKIVSRKRLSDSVFHCSMAAFRVKLRSLVEERKIIRSEMDKAKTRRKKLAAKRAAETEISPRENTLLAVSVFVLEHTKFVINPEIRATHIAQAYFRNKPYASCEPGCKKPVDTRRVAAIVRSLSGGELAVTTAEIQQWIDG